MEKGTRILIFTGGTLDSWATRHIRKGDVLVGVDRGALFLVEHGYKPDYALGDFDSVSEEEKNNIMKYAQTFSDCDPVMKDQTDTEMAFEWALEQHPGEVLLLGALGTRFDHSLANVHLLRRGLDKGISCRIIDPYNELRLTNQQLLVQKGAYHHVSLLPLSLKVTGITLDGFQYPLQDATLNLGDSLGISNVLLGESGKITISDGLLLVIQSKD
ncbi:thiamine diphosphokinase [Ammoniphilus sp. YIM 78166]|uniref:thiamine diphosphokinase n=1 Tax=Ammoniphilus sp. YIM 78166 TaxID=1644106 RepID=UPI001070174C|nr:thiamine diphosphokinase [Ammoniphilus sp. YIM 78166]